MGGNRGLLWKAKVVSETAQLAGEAGNTVSCISPRTIYKALEKMDPDTWPEAALRMTAQMSKPASIVLQHFPGASYGVESTAAKMLAFARALERKNPQLRAYLESSEGCKVVGEVAEAVGRQVTTSEAYAKAAQIIGAVTKQDPAATIPAPGSTHSPASGVGRAK